MHITGAGHISAPLEIGKTVSIDSAAFGYASAELSEEVKAELKEKSKDLEFLNYEKIEISGHSDSTGSDITNNRLSRARAKAVADYLIESGVERHKIEYWGEGSKKPVASNATQEGRAQNRRVEISIK